MSVRDAPKSESVGIAESATPRWTVRVWQVPVRIIHWTIFFAVIVLSVTGFYIGNPFLTVGSDPQFVMGWMRSIHLIAAWVFIAAVLARIIWAFTGNRWSRWDQFIPVGKDRREGGREALRYYLFLRREAPASIGHNPLAGLTYTVVFVMFLVQIITGLALHGLDDPGGLLSDLTNWVFNLGSIPAVRLTHHLTMWLTWGFVVHHVYSVVLMENAEKNGLMSSMLSGRKQVRKDLL